MLLVETSYITLRVLHNQQKGVGEKCCLTPGFQYLHDFFWHAQKLILKIKLGFNIEGKALQTMGWASCKDI
jgi:hypothetical protein